MLRLPSRSRSTRWWVIGYGLLVFLWIAPEDKTVLPAVLLGMGGGILLLYLQTIERIGGRQIPARYVPLILGSYGAIIGFLTSMFTALLMLFKNARHAHITPDFPPAMIGGILERAPVWMIAGALVGFGLSFTWLAMKT